MSATHLVAPPEAALERALPSYDERLVCEITVDAPAALAYAAIRETNLLDPVVRALFGMREIPARWVAWLRGRPRPASVRAITVADFLRSGTGMSLVSEREGRELVIGSVGRFWRRDYGHLEVAGEDFTAFSEPGYAKLAMGFEVRALASGRAAVRYEARTATTDAEARRRFRRYWRIIRPGVWLVMRRALVLIRREAERRASAQA